MVEHSSNLYTRKGDTGSTRLSGRKAAPKDSLRIQAIGDLDELNCQLGVIRAYCRDAQMQGFFAELQTLLLELELELTQPGTCRIAHAHTARAEQFIDRLDAALPSIEGKLVPGGDADTAHCYLARAVCRRAERSLFRLSRTEHVNAASLQFLNRLSDLLFVVARTLNHRAKKTETLWTKNVRRNPT
jgi:cob(I)alamin adenosyltransferase